VAAGSRIVPNGPEETEARVAVTREGGWSTSGGCDSRSLPNGPEGGKADKGVSSPLALVQ
jgi:hypothetical protein